MQTKIVPLSQLCKISGRVGWKGYTVDDLRDSGPLVIGANDIDSNHQLDLKEVKHISREKFEESPEIIIEINDILIVKVGSTIGKVAIVNEDIGEACINPNTVLLKNCKINPHFIYYTLISSYGQSFLLNNSSASAQPALNQTTLKEMIIHLPEDESIINNLSTVLNRINTKIKLNNKINEELEGMAKLIYDYWFVQFDFPISKEQAQAMGKPELEGKPYKSSGGKMVFNKELKREIPEGWVVEALGEQINIFDSERVPLSRKEREKKPGKIPYFGATGIMDYVADYLFDDEYVLIAEDGSVMDEKGMPIVQFIWGKTWVNNHAHVIQAINKLNNEFIYQLVKMIPVVLIKTGSIQMKINQENLKSHKVLIPKNELIEDYSRMSSLIRKKLINNVEQNQKLTELRDWLLPMLMNGQVTVGEAEKELSRTADA